MPRKRLAVAVLLLIVAGLGLAAPGPAVADDLTALPPNQWVQLAPPEPQSGYDYAPMVFVPSRGGLLQWGGVLRRYQVKIDTRNDVRFFDVASGWWTSDYPISEKCPTFPTGGGSGEGGYGVNYVGTEAMLPDGKPYPSAIVAGAVYDSKRDKLIYPLPGVMPAYDVKARTWADTGCKTELHGQSLPGGPPVASVGACYDPVNDEIVLFPHVANNDQLNVDLRDATGEISSHLGTFRYSFADNTWRRAGDSFGSDAVRQARSSAVKLLTPLSRSLDELYVLRHRPDPAKAAALGKSLADLAETVAKADLTEACKAATAKAAESLRSAAQAASAGKINEAMTAGCAALATLRATLDDELRVEPPARCAAPMVYDPKNQVIVMFGGHSGLVRTDLVPQGGRQGWPGAHNDTWLYDCKTRQWRELETKNRPPADRSPKMVYDPASGLMILATFAGGNQSKPGLATLWTLDVAKGEWLNRGKQSWPFPITSHGAATSSNPTINLGLDAKAGLLLMSQNLVEKNVSVERVYALKLDVSKLPAEPAPANEPEPAVIAQRVDQPDDAQWLAKLDSLAPNTWLYSEPPHNATRRDWGNAAIDPHRGQVYYFGGGHSTYQVNDVCIYLPGANLWSFAAGDHNDFIPPVGWGGALVGYRGGVNAHHMRNQYVAFDGRMYVSSGGRDKINRGDNIPKGQEKVQRYCWFYDVDRGGVWRQQPVETIRGQDVDGDWGAVHVSTHDGRIIGFVGDRTSYYGETFPKVFVSVLDVFTNKLDIRSAPAPFPQRLAESRPFCWLADRNQVLYVEHSKNHQRTWLYDVKDNKFIDLEVAPPGQPANVVYLDGQDAAWAVIGNQQYVFSFAQKKWAKLPTEGLNVKFNRPYGQEVYVPQRKLLVNVAGGTFVMKPDVSKIDWSKSE